MMRRAYKGVTRLVSGPGRPAARLWAGSRVAAARAARAASPPRARAPGPASRRGAAPGASWRRAERRRFWAGPLCCGAWTSLCVCVCVPDCCPTVGECLTETCTSIDQTREEVVLCSRTWSVAGLDDATGTCLWNLDETVLGGEDIERERESITPYQPHRADAGAARTSPGTSGRRIESQTTPKIPKYQKPRSKPSRPLRWRHPQIPAALETVAYTKSDARQSQDNITALGAGSGCCLEGLTNP